MQKRPKYAKWFSPTGLPEDFPLYVSRPYVQHDSEITALHVHDAFELGLCLEGAGIFVVEGKVMPFQAGDAFAVSSRESHLAQSSPGTKSRWIWVYADIEKLLCQFCEDTSLLVTSRFAGEKFRNVISRADQPRLCRLLREFCEEAQDARLFTRDSLRAQVLLIMVELRRICPVAPKGEEPELQSVSDSVMRIQKALLYLLRHYREKIKIDGLAELCGLSRTHFRRLFREALGRSPQEHLNRLRIMMAVAELKEGKKSISELALSCGFPTLSSFNRQFKAQLGQSPRGWKRGSL